jgi:two-component system chemotaxis response regulator CheB
MIGHDVIVIGASAGGVEALKYFVSSLPADLPAALFVVLHFPAHGTSVLPAILSRAGKLPAEHAQDGQIFENGRIYVAPPDYHLILKRDHIRLTRGPHENRNRPAVDPLFRTAARIYGRRVVGVVLSGTLDDGTAGLIAIKACGGITMVQDPAESLYAGMPQNAIEHDHVDFVLKAADLAYKVVDLAHTAVTEAKAEDIMADEIDFESDMAELDMQRIEAGGERPGRVSGYMCPECGGMLWEIENGDLLRFRCRVGHAYSEESLVAEQTEALEDAFWVALRALEESAALSHQLAQRAANRGRAQSAVQFAEQARSAEDRAQLIRSVLLKGILHPASTPPRNAEPTVDNIVETGGEQS